MDEPLRRGDMARDAVRLYAADIDCDPDVERDGKAALPGWLKAADDVEG